MFKLKSILLFFWITLLPHAGAQIAGAQEAYVRNPVISSAVWDHVQPYLLPPDHPIKPKLDRIFKKGVLTDAESLRKAGFKFKLRRDRFMIIAGHRDLKGYVLKLYVDKQKLREGEWLQWIKRIEGADRIRTSIESNSFGHFMKVPQKWIYPLPSQAVAKPAGDCFPKFFVLVAEKMDIVTHGKNRAKYRFMMHEELLEALFVVMKENLLIDSMFLDNIPFCKDHRIAFVDTEHSNTRIKPMPYEQMLNHLSPKMRKFWKTLIVNK
ncbi:MAG: hypothetical protein LLG04_05360 [Parachlamydia sp.]|nr:hypothetical protein [Parachlamydia sp.]